MSVSRARRWMQSSTLQVRLVAAGEWWDAVRVPLTLGNKALEHLGDRTGAVIKDGFGSCLYWLIRPGTAADWNLAQVKVLGPGSHVAVPPLHRVTGPGLYWQVPPSRDREWTSAALLHTALRTSLSPETRPHEPESRPHEMRPTP
ncbi:hypothetical protein AB5J56_11735 [Streptomyces sp. R21]|uniref:DNA primase/polymerase bifunctional N-terminal domain-containing protein n=1 Tax=Streptomyces sp. R21 TaxID=3238627 RepID=A0AB39P8B1_9ACTN